MERKKFNDVSISMVVSVLRCSGISHIYREKRRRLKTIPWGAPIRSGKKGEIKESSE